MLFAVDTYTVHLDERVKLKTYTKTEITQMNLQSLIGTIGTLTVGQLDVNVKVVDVRVRFGHVDLLVEPTNGSGTEWVEKHRITSNEHGWHKNVPKFAQVTKVTQ